MTRYALSQPPPGQGLKTWSRSWEVQRAPYREPLPYSYSGLQETVYPFTSDGLPRSDYAAMQVEPTGVDLTRLTGVVNMARSQAVSRIKEGRGAALALTLIDWRSSLDIVTNALKGLSDKAARKTLYYKRRSSSLYLEGVFGWLPLMQDIYDAYQVLSGPLRSSPVKANASIIYSKSIKDTNHKLTVQTELGARIGAMGRMTNPNLALLGDLGLINPLAVAWDKVPYSFVVNWFLPVGAFLESLTDLVGYEVTRAYTTTYVRKTCSGSIREQNPVSGEYVWMPRFVQLVRVNRALGFPTPALPQLQLPSADLFKSLVTLSLLNENLRKPARTIKRAWKTRDYTE